MRFSLPPLALQIGSAGLFFRRASDCLLSLDASPLGSILLPLLVGILLGFRLGIQAIHTAASQTA